MSSMSPPDYSSSLVYTVGEDNGTILKALCVVKSADSSQFSDEVKVKIVSKDSSSIEYFGRIYFNIPEFISVKPEGSKF